MPNDTDTISTALLEALAAYAHTAWSGWMQYLFAFGDYHSDGSFTIRPDAVTRWDRQMRAEYADLPEEEKESDRKEADAMLAIVGAAYAEQAKHIDGLRQSSAGLYRTVAMMGNALLDAEREIAELRASLRSAARAGGG